MKYRIELSGYGRELRIESVSQEIWDYVQDKFNGDADDYWNAVDSGDVPDEFVLAESVWNIGDIYDESACYVRGAYILVEDENGNEVYSLNGRQFQNSRIQGHRYTEQVGKGNRYVMEFISEEKGDWLSGTFETDSKFDPAKLTMNFTVLFYGDKPFDGSIVNGFEYDGKEIECDFLGSEGISISKEFKEINLDNEDGDNDEEIEKNKQLQEKMRIEAQKQIEAQISKPKRIGKAETFELVKKYLTEVAPNPMSFNDIMNKLKEDGFPETKSFSTRVYGLLSNWAKEGKIVRATPGTYKLADK